MPGTQKPVRSPLFESSSATDVRFVWDRLVHSWHGEECSLLLLKLPGIELNSRSAVERIAEDVGLISTSVYVLYGSYDILVRSWSTAMELDHLIAALEKQLPDVKIERFLVHEINYSAWSACAERANPSAILAHQTEIRDLVSLKSGGRTESIIANLEKAGLLHRYFLEPQNHTQLLKIYLILRRQGVDDPPLTKERMRRLEGVLDTVSFLRMPSVYYGAGRTVDCAIKGLIAADEIGTLHEEVFGLKKRLEEAGLILRPMTMILARAGETDRDHLRLEIPGPDSLAVRQIKGLFPNIAEHWNDIEQWKRDAVVKVFDRHWSDVAGTPYMRYFLDSIEGALEADTYKINASLNFLLVLEAEIRKAAIFFLLPSELGPKDWRDTVVDYLESEAQSRQVLEDAGGPKADEARQERHKIELLLDVVRQRTDRIGLGETIHLIRRLVKGEIIDASKVRAVLGNKWFENYLPASELRNDFTHGRILTTGQWPVTLDEVGHWESLAERALPVGMLMGHLETLKTAGEQSGV